MAEGTWRIVFTQLTFLVLLYGGVLTAVLGSVWHNEVAIAGGCLVCGAVSAVLVKYR